MKNLYYNSTGSVRIGDFQTQPFQYARGVRQVCILSPRLFNLYINDLAFSCENILSDPFVLPCNHGTKLSSLLYADDLIIVWVRPFMFSGRNTQLKYMNIMVIGVQQ